MTHAADFLALSELLTAEPSLDAAIADAYRLRLTGTFPADLPRLIDAYREAAAQADPAAALQAALDADTALARAAKEAIAVWYTSEFTRPDNRTDPPDTPGHYRAGLIWKVIKAHPISAAPEPPAPSGYGYWTQHPEARTQTWTPSTTS
ncbi:sugar dehydrogenase complex small subunit [Streptomyces sp. NPDC058290]|uniref:sugar dehydrogenase complex small subunit n=1 Tax=Streptomyces sp. NPDC058290 TaxID=3346426 RepID=UPI0036F16F8F